MRNDLLLNPTKTEAITTGTRQQIARLDSSGGVVVAGVVVPFFSTLRVLSVTLDSELSFDEHITRTDFIDLYPNNDLNHTCAPENISGHFGLLFLRAPYKFQFYLRTYLLITGVVHACNYHLCALRHIRHLIDRKAANAIACSIVDSRLDYCNSILFGITDKNICRLQRVPNSLARVVCGATYYSPTTALRRSLHWLPSSSVSTIK